MHHVLVRHVGVGEDNIVDVVLADQVGELGLGPDRDPFGIELARQEWGIDAPCDVGDLRRRERDDVVLVAVSIDDVEVVEVAAGRARDQDLRPHVYELCIQTADRPS